MRSHVLVVLCCLAMSPMGLEARGQAAADPFVSMRLLAIPGIASGINNLGDVVGHTDYRAYLWTERSGVVELGTLPGMPYCQASAVNNLRHVVGWCWGGEDRLAHAFLWTADRGMRDIGLGLATAINDRDEVAGGGAISDLWQEAWRWSDGVRELLGLGGTSSAAWGITEAGAICAAGPDNWSIHGYRWTPATGLLELPFIGAPYDMNEGGEIATGAAATWGAQIWRSDSGLIELGTPPGRYGAATGINDMSYAVGTTTDNDTEYRYAFAWTADSGYTEIGGPESFAYKINNLAEVAGSAVGDDGIAHPAIWRLRAGAGPRLRAVAATLRAQIAAGTVARRPAQSLLRAIENWTPDSQAISLKVLRVRIAAALWSGHLPAGNRWMLRAIAQAEAERSRTDR